jgi:DNA polymerase II large subunit
MKDKMLAQLALGQRLRAVSAQRVASQVIESHFLPDLRGNLMAFTRQKVRCVKCAHSYRRIPLAGKCIQNISINGGLSGGRGDGSTLCGGNVVLTVSEGAVRKYIEITREVIENYGVDDYTKQRVEWMTDSVDSLFNDDTVTVMTLNDFV